MSAADRRARIRELNDRMRALGPASTPTRRWLFTSGVQALGPDVLAVIVERLQTFSDFTINNDPHGEHDFGSFSVGDDRVFWKIDYYNRSLDGGSPDASDEEVTCRVLTIMLPQEY